MSGAPTRTALSPIRVLLLPDAPHADGEPRAALQHPPKIGAMDRRPVLQLFATLGAALKAKQRMEGDNVRP